MDKRGKEKEKKEAAEIGAKQHLLGSATSLRPAKTVKTAPNEVAEPGQPGIP